jgi:hypothetical protein
MSAGGPQPVSCSKVVGAGGAVRRRRGHPAHIEGLIRLVSVRIVRLSELILRIGASTFNDRFGGKPTDLRILIMLGAYQPISMNEVSRRTRFHLIRERRQQNARAVFGRPIDGGWSDNDQIAAWTQRRRRQ